MYINLCICLCIHEWNGYIYKMWNESGCRWVYLQNVLMNIIKMGFVSNYLRCVHLTLALAMIFCIRVFLLKILLYAIRSLCLDCLMCVYILVWYFIYVDVCVFGRIRFFYINFLYQDLNSDHSPNTQRIRRRQFWFYLHIIHTIFSKCPIFN